MGYIKQLKDKLKNQIYPVTKASAVYMNETQDTVERVLNDLRDQNTTIEFKDTGDIVKTLASENVITTRFNADGSITETTADKNGKVIEVKTTTFDEDGTIRIEVKES